jgi:hypothetical protein
MSESTESELLKVDRASREAAEYFKAVQAAVELLQLIITTVIRLDFVSYSARRAIERDDRAAETGQMPEHDRHEITDPLDLMRVEPGTLTKAYRRSRQSLLQMLFARAVDNFETYLVSIIREALRKRPEILSKSTYPTLTMEIILEHHTVDSLVHHLIESKVNDLSYRGFPDLTDWCQDRGITLVVPPGKSEEVAELIATRNVITHNRGIVDQKYVRSVKAPNFKLGDVRKFDNSTLLASISLLNKVVDATDKAIVTNFGLETVEVSFLEVSL